LVSAAATAAVENKNDAAAGTAMIMSDAGTTIVDSF